MPRRRRRQFTPIEWLIMVAITGILFAITAPARSPRRPAVRHTVSAPAARPPRPTIPVELPDTAKRVVTPPSILRLWSRVQNWLVLTLALHVITRALRRPKHKPPATHQNAPAP